jgi:hypothetical protein
VLTRLRSRLTYANVMSTIAVFCVLTGVGFAVAKMKVPKNSVGAKQLKTNAVHSKKISKNAVNASKIASGAVGRSEIANGAVGNGEISNGAVSTKKIADGAVTKGKIDPNSLPLISTLSSGQTLRGSFDLGSDQASLFRAGQTFQFPLLNAPAAPAANVIDASVASPAFTSACPGIGGGNGQTPNAAAGQLCIYITSHTGNFTSLVVDPGSLTRLGFGLLGTFTGVTDHQVAGQWAVTAP